MTESAPDNSYESHDAANEPLAVPDGAGIGRDSGESYAARTKPKTADPGTASGSAALTLLPPGFCLNCGHHEDTHLLDEQGVPSVCAVEVSDHGDLDCQCPGLRLCAACEGDPEAHGLHVCGREDGC